MWWSVSAPLRSALRPTCTLTPQAPLTEELLFRSLLLPLALLTARPPQAGLFLTPLTFAAAHLNHLYEFALTNPGRPLRAAAALALLQFAYTTLFGWFAAFVFLRTGSLWACVAVHAFCNSMGLPRVWGRVEAWEEDDEDEGGGGGAARLGLGWSVAYYVLLVAGAVGFRKGLWVLTASERRLAEL
jgi:prenyl protein peptidase